MRRTVGLRCTICNHPARPQIDVAIVIGDKSETAYRRSTAIERRRGLMQAWADYCGDNG